ncbi:MAG: asparagine synthase C-terminal domain-containing protein [Gallionellaceae bacterium]
MTGLSGWIGPLDHDIDPSTLLGKMMVPLGLTEPRRNLASATYALGAYSPFGLASVHDEEGLLAAIDGRVTWDDARLAHQAQQHSPAAALHAAYLRWGKDCLTHMHGPFSLAILEPASGMALLAIDRLGINRLCFATHPSGLVFGSTCDSVATHPGIGRCISSQCIFNYLYHHMVPAPGTIYEGVEKLLPAQYLWYRDGQQERRFYWEADWSVRLSWDFDQYRQTLKQLLRESVGSAIDQRNTGAFLSGGTDSSTIAGILAQVSGKPPETFSIGFKAEGFDEMEYARIAANRFATHPHEYYVTPNDVVAAIPLIAAAYDEPFGNASAVPTYFCALKAKEAGIDIMLAGDGGDEIFGGNARYATQKIFEVYQHIPAPLRQHLIEPLALHLPGVSPLRKIASYVRQARVPLPDRLETYNFLHSVALDELFTPEFLSAVDPDEPLLNMREVYSRTRSASAIDRMLHLDWKHTLADNDLRKVNRMCELAGVEVRYPLLDERMVAFAAQLPPTYKVKGTKLRWFFKEALRDFLPDEIINKSKHGFGLPFGLWMQQHAPLHELAHESLRAFRTRSIVRTTYLDELDRLHQTGNASYYGVMIWVIMMLEQWLQKHEEVATSSAGQD